MKPRGALMIEHRLIEKVLAVIKKKLNDLSKDNFDPLFIDTVVDFIRVYADRTHHGKEEDILFKELEKKNVVKEDTVLMNDLIEDHKQARKKVKELVEYNNEFKKGNKNDFNGIIEILKWLISFYPAHIKREDDTFFPDTEKYFSKEELDKMLNDFWEFDRKMIHEKYQKVYNSLAE